MSGNVEQVIPPLTVHTVCPILLNPQDAISTYAMASKIATLSNANSGLNACNPNAYELSQVYTAAEAGTCCGNIIPGTPATPNS